MLSKHYRVTIRHTDTRETTRITIVAVDWLDAKSFAPVPDGWEVVRVEEAATHWNLVWAVSNEELGNEE